MNWRKICICTLMTTNIFISSAGAMDKPVTIVDQGSFFCWWHSNTSRRQ